MRLWYKVAVEETLFQLPVSESNIKLYFGVPWRNSTSNRESCNVSLHVSSSSLAPSFFRAPGLLKCLHTVLCLFILLWRHWYLTPYRSLYTLHRSLLNLFLDFHTSCLHRGSPSGILVNKNVHPTASSSEKYAYSSNKTIPQFNQTRWRKICWNRKLHAFMATLFVVVLCLF